MKQPAHTLSEKKILAVITPAPRPPIIIEKSLERLRLTIKKQQINATVQLGGSLAKGTYLKGDHDVDVFVRFSPDYDDKELAEYLEKSLRTTFKNIERVHGSRDYFHVQLGAYLFEFIPVLNVSSWAEARNVTDMSPLHVAYVTEHTRKRPWLAGEIRLTKQFMKAAKVYGAESYIGGFSGHVVDLLIIYYGGFRALLAAASNWSRKVVLDPQNSLTNPLIELNAAKTLAPLVIVDPVQQDRNSAAAVALFAFNKFRAVVKQYLSAHGKDQADFFRITPLDVGQIKKEHKDALVLVATMVPLSGKKDVVGAKCYKVYQHCVQQLLDHEFSLIASHWEFTVKKATLVFILPKKLLSLDEKLVGPPVHKTTDVARFTKVHKITFVHEGKVYATEHRKFRDPKKLLLAVLKEKYVKERVKSVKIS